MVCVYYCRADAGNLAGNRMPPQTRSQRRTPPPVRAKREPPPASKRARRIGAPPVPGRAARSLSAELAAVAGQAGRADRAQQLADANIERLEKSIRNVIGLVGIDKRVLEDPRRAWSGEAIARLSNSHAEHEQVLRRLQLELQRLQGEPTPPEIGAQAPAARSEFER